MAFSERTRIKALAALSLGLLTGLQPSPAHPQSTGTVYLPDPTPRDRDLHDRYSDSPALQEQRTRTAAMRRTQQRLQVTADINEIQVLAQQLRNHRIQHESAAGPSDSLTAQKIESLAKRAKENMQSR